MQQGQSGRTRRISAKNLDFKALNALIHSADGALCIADCCGQRFIGSGLSCQQITIQGTPGNALGSYLNGGEITVNGNAQDAVGDTMNDGRIIIHGHAGDALGYAMRGGSIFVRDSAGYRAGVHMKEYTHKKPVMVIGGRAGRFLGEYLAGGVIVVLGLGAEEIPIGDYAGTGMHGGSIFVRTNHDMVGLPRQVTATVASQSDILEITPLLSEFAGYFGLDATALTKDRFYRLRPNAQSPYKQRYTYY